MKTAGGMQNLISFTADGGQLLPAPGNFALPGGTHYSAPIKAMDEIMD